jgi:hypothetical protein
VLESLGIDGGVQPTVLCLRRLRQEAPMGYSYRKLSMEHHACGGLTDSTVQIHVYSASGGESLWEFESVSGRDLNCLVDPKVSGFACPAPRAAPEGKPQVVRVRPNTYHVGGLYPSGELAP